MFLIALVSNEKTMNQQTKSKTDVKPWTVISIQGKKKCIVKRFKSSYDAHCYQSLLEQNSTNGVTFRVRFLTNLLPTDDGD